MGSNKLIALLMVVGSVVGGYVPALFGIDTFSFTGLVTSAAGAVAGIWLGYRLSR